MTIFIAPIGRTTEHVKSWLKEESRDLHILWLIHSPKDEIDFPKIAKDLQKIIIDPAYTFIVLPLYGFAVVSISGGLYELLLVLIKIISLYL